MVWRILKYLIIATILSLIATWIWEGGITAIWNNAVAVQNPVSWQHMADFGADISSKIPLPQGIDAVGPNMGPGVNPDASANSDQNFGNESSVGPAALGPRSRYAGMVAFASGQAESPSAASEYLTIAANPSNTASVSLAGWSIESMVSGERVVIPEAATIFELGIVNNVSPVVLDPGGSLVVATGPSPVGVGFRENLCTGYLGNPQSFIPALSLQCPNGSDVLPATLENLQTYGAGCIDYAATIPSCSTVTDVPPQISNACRSVLTNAFTYNGCVAQFHSQQNFLLPTWRVYLGRTQELWSNSHDVIRLVDASGATVDAISY